MRFVKRSDLMKMPKGTLYMKFTPMIFGELQVFCSKEDWGNDFVYRPLIAIDANDSGEEYDIVTSALVTGESIKLDQEATSRDGMFETDEQMFAVLEKADLLAFASTIIRALANFQE